MADAREGAASGLQTDGYEYFPAHARWSTAVRGAAKHVEAELVKTREASGKLEAINSSRLQLKFPRTIDALPPALRALVELLEAQVVASAGLDEALVLQDCYALFTPADEESEEARAPQRWHLDAIKKFPVAALCLNGGRWTEFADGPYSDFSAGVPEPTLERWSAPWRSMSVATWESESAEEWEHWSRHLHAARLVTADEECDWDLLPVAPTPPRSHVGDASIFWSNKVHRGPATEMGEERLVLFCSWMPVGAGGGPGPEAPQRADGRRGSSAASAQSETDYSFYDGHLEPKLRLSKRATRSIKRAAEAGAEPRRRRGRHKAA